MRRSRILVVLSLCSLVVCGCQLLVPPAPRSYDAAHKPMEMAPQALFGEGPRVTRAVSPVQEERDEIYTLLAYAVVLKDWQTRGPGQQRGHNIGCVLVDGDGKVVFWARNCNHITGNGTQHGEVRVMIGYLSKVHTYSLRDHTVYTTLEPCAQCSGMMTLTSIARTVYGQTDPGFGKALERLALDTHKLPELLPQQFKHGYKPYPRRVRSEPSKCRFRQELDDAYDPEQGSLTRFLLTDEAKAIYMKAREALRSYEVKQEDNRAVLKEAIEFLNNEVKDDYTPLKLKL